MKNSYHTDMCQDTYRKSEGLANSELQVFAINPAAHVWSAKAPQDPAKVAAKDLGTALHAKLLEPDTYNDILKVSSVKGRQSQAFQKEVEDNPNHIVLPEIEAKQVDVMAISAMCHPKMAECLTVEGDNECSVFVFDEARGFMRKVRPDRYNPKTGFVFDLKKTADLSKWRSYKEWENPLYQLSYAYTAAYYMDTLSIYQGSNVNEYIFGAVQSSASLGRYPVSTFSITRDELVKMGVWAEVQHDLDCYAEFIKQKKPTYQHENFNFIGDEVEIIPND